MTRLRLFVGPCVLHPEQDYNLLIAEKLATIAERTSTDLVFKASFDKANRSRHDGYRGPGLEKGLEMFEAIKSRTGLPIITDIHLPSQASDVAEVATIIQIPALLCRQTDLLHAAAMTGRELNIKKGPFIPPKATAWIVDKLKKSGADNINITERGYCFGYDDLIIDPRALFRLLELGDKYGFRVVFDATHSLKSNHWNGPDDRRRFIGPLMNAAAAVGVTNFFLETYPDPDDPNNALCDGRNAVPLNRLEALLEMPRIIASAIAQSNIYTQRS